MINDCFRVHFLINYAKHLLFRLYIYKTKHEKESISILDANIQNIIPNKYTRTRVHTSFKKEKC